MVTSAGRAKILDFGLAKMSAGKTDAEISRRGCIIGTYHAMSPEQAMGLAVDPRSDLFSLGSLLYEMLTGASPFRGGNATETLAPDLRHQQPPVHDVRREVPQEVSDLIDRLLAKDPRQRPANASEVASRPRVDRARSGAPRRRSAAAALPRKRTMPTLPAAFHPADAHRRAQPPHHPRAAAGDGPICELPASRNPGGPSPWRSTWRPSTRCCPRCGGGAGRGAVRRHGRRTSWATASASTSAIRRRTRTRRGAPSAPPWSSCRARASAWPRDRPDGRRRAAVDPYRHAIVSTARAGAAHPGRDARHRAGHPRPAPGKVLASTATQRLLKEASSGGAPPLRPWRRGESRRSTDPGGGRRSRKARAAWPRWSAASGNWSSLTRWEPARPGTGQAVVISGEAGMGKSRLLRALRERVARSAGRSEARWLSVHGSPTRSSSPCNLAVDLLQRTLARSGQPAAAPAGRLLGPSAWPSACRLFAVAPRHPPETRSAGPADAARPAAREDAGSAGRVAARDGGPQAPRAALRRPSLARSVQLPGSSLSSTSVSAPLLPRDDGAAGHDGGPWGPRARVDPGLPVSAERARDTARLIDCCRAGRPCPRLQPQIVARTDGVPLFVEELTTIALEAASRNPANSDDAARFVGRPPGPPRRRQGGRQLASVIGRTFSLPLLAAIAPPYLDALEQELRRLVQSGLSIVAASACRPTIRSSTR